LNLIDENDRGDELCCARPLGLGNRETCRDVVTRMTGGTTGIDIVQVVIPEGSTVGE
jgi:hypothetical protein